MSAPIPTTGTSVPCTPYNNTDNNYLTTVFGKVTCMSPFAKFMFYVSLPALAALMFVLLAYFTNSPGLVSAIPDPLGRLFLMGFILFVFMLCIFAGWLAILQHYPLCMKRDTPTINN
jgi:hypothetical protein